MSHRLALPALLVLLLVPLGPARADVVVVAATRSGIDRLSVDEVINIFLGRYRRLPSGMAAVPIDLPAGPLKAEFYRKLADKDLAEINAYWARLYFSGRTTPPLQAESPAAALRLIAGTPGAIGYVDRSQLDPRVRIVLDFGS